MDQMQLVFEPWPLCCEHRRYEPSVQRVWCGLHEVWTACGQPFYGGLAPCAYDEPDNSEEARKRRLEWLREHKEDA